MKILAIIPEYPPDFGGGIVSYYRDLIPALGAQGYKASILKGSAFVHGTGSYKHEGVPVSILETARFHRWHDRFAHFGMFPELRRHLAAAFALHEQAKAGEKFDVVEVTDWGMLFLPWALETKCRVLVQAHGSSGQIAHCEPVAGHEAEGACSLWLEKAGLEANVGLSAYSRANAEWWKSLLHRPVSYLPPPLSLQIETEAKSDANNSWLSVGRIQLWKGPHVACAAWKLLGTKAPQLDWVGRDTRHGESGQSTNSWLRNEFPTVWDGQIKPVGQIQPSEVHERIRKAKAVLVPSLWDTFNLAAAEAMALGKVTVISSGAGAADLVEHGVNGFVFPKGDVKALAEIVEQVEKLSRTELEKIGERAAATVREKLDPKRIAMEKLKLYQNLPAAGADRLPWLKQSLLPNTGSHALGFLDGLPLKELTRYLGRRGFKKLTRSASRS